MSRDDSGLYTGASSASFGTTHEDPTRKAIREQKKEIRGQFKPAAEIVFAEIQKEIHELIHGTYEGEDTMSDEQFRTERRARRVAVERLTALNNRFSNLLREPRRPKQEANDE